MTLQAINRAVRLHALLKSVFHRIEILWRRKSIFLLVLEDARLDQKSESISDCILISALKRTFSYLNGRFRT